MLGEGKLFEKSFSSHLVMPNNQAPLFSKPFEMGDNVSFYPNICYTTLGNHFTALMIQ